MKLVIGNKNYSSWSLRPWLLLTHAGIAFKEEKLSFNAPDFKARALRASPAGRVPVLVDGDVAVWDSLAIAEYVAEKFPEKKLWPDDRAARARARSICAEMHAGFAALRAQLPMNCELHHPNVPLSEETRRDVDRIVRIWTECREAHAARGPFLFGEFSVADAYYAPVTRRFISYGISLPTIAVEYIATIDALPAMRQWVDAAKAEHDFVQEDEPYRRKP
jgi:glutathione S-transferase